MSYTAISFIWLRPSFRTGRGLDNRLIAGRPVTDRTGRVRCRRRLGGLLNFYERAA